MYSIVTRIIQITLMTAIKATSSVTRLGITGREDVTALVRSSTSSVLKSAFIKLLYLHAITNSHDLKTNRKPQAKCLLN